MIKKKFYLIFLLALVFLTTMPARAASLKLNTKKITMTAGRTKTLAVSTGKKVKWKSSRPSVASVSPNGKIKAKKKGKATITATVAGQKLRCQITVKKAGAMVKLPDRYIRKSSQPGKVVRIDYKTTVYDGEQKTREHRAFGGFSRGSVTTWHTFINCLDYFKYFMPMSGDCWIYGQMGAEDTDYRKTAAYLDKIAKDSGYTVKDYYIYAVIGSEDIVYEPLSGQVKAMRKYKERFVYSPDFTKGNFYYGVIKGGEHDYPSMLNYIYNALPNFRFSK